MGLTKNPLDIKCSKNEAEIILKFSIQLTMPRCRVITCQDLIKKIRKEAKPRRFQYLTCERFEEM
jgi:hypothetical protein